MIVGIKHHSIHEIHSLHMLKFHAVVNILLPHKDIYIFKSLEKGKQEKCV